jgi:tetratricopeptide (TPR) repeat protein
MLCLSLASLPAIAGQETANQQLLQWIEQENTASAIELARRLDEDPTTDFDLTIALARLARALEKSGEIETASEFYRRAVDASQRPPAKNLPLKTVVIIRLAAASAIVQTTDYPSALDLISPVFADDPNQLGDAQRKLAVAICLQVGAKSLRENEPIRAGKAYDLASAHAAATDRATALLGTAWAAVRQPSEPQLAVAKLAEFIAEFPAHPESPQAVRACLQCVRLSASETDPPLIPAAVQSWLLSTAKAGDGTTLDAPLSAAAIRIAVDQDDSMAWSNSVQRLAQTDQSGQLLSDLLSELPPAEATRLATIVLSPTEPDGAGWQPLPAAREAVARWAGRSSNWTLLAAAAELEQPATPSASRNTGVERLFAESLMQLGRIQESKQWWDYLVDVRGETEFSTLLRCAEAETTVGSDAALADRRIEAAQAAAAADDGKTALVNVLRAELQVRRTDFDGARATLESIVRTADTDASIRCRAQWLIGETYYLQQQYAAAIDAYRRVEGIAGADESSGQWIAACLVQSGKSFEQLGRTREAALCYGNLLHRFPDTAYARLARLRMAVLVPDQRPGDAPSTPQPIRR